MLKSFDPQKRATDILRLLAKQFPTRSKEYWRTVEYLADAIAKDTERETIVNDDMKKLGGRKLSKRWRADMLKVSAIMQEQAAAHIEVLREPEPPQNLIKLMELR